MSPLRGIKEIVKWNEPPLTWAFNMYYELLAGKNKQTTVSSKAKQRQQLAKNIIL